MTNNMNDNTVRIWTDGACIGNPGPGGWGYLKSFGEKTRRGSGLVCGSTTSNQMELIAVIQAIRSLKRPDLPAVIYSDSKYVVDGVNLCLSGWMANGWYKSKGDPVMNVDLWKALQALLVARLPGAEITFVWVKGHAGCLENEEADRLANLQARKAEKLVGAGCAKPTRYDPERGLVVPVFEPEDAG